MSGHHHIVLGKNKTRSRLSNGHVFSRSVDERSAWARRYKDLLIVHLNDLGGPDNVSAAEAAILKRACTLIVEAERLEEKFAIAGQAELEELDAFQRVSNTLRRLLSTLGLSRRQRDITPTDLQSYLREKAEGAR
jgi:hypothetical protein